MRRKNASRETDGAVAEVQIPLRRAGDADLVRRDSRAASTACCFIRSFQTISRSTRRTGISLFVKLSQLGSTAIERTPRRTAVRSSGTSEKISPGLDATSSDGPIAIEQRFGPRMRDQRDR